MLSDCERCWETLCCCGWKYREWSISKLEKQINMLERVKQFKEENSNIIFEYPRNGYTKNDKSFQTFMKC